MCILLVCIMQLLLFFVCFFFVFEDWAVQCLYRPPGNCAYSSPSTRVIPRRLPPPVFRFLLSPAANLFLDDFALVFMVHFIYHTLQCLCLGLCLYRPSQLLVVFVRLPVCYISPLVFLNPQSSRYGASLRFGRSGDRIPLGARFSIPVMVLILQEVGLAVASSRMGTSSLLGVKRPELGVNHPFPSRVEVKERVELHLCFPSVPSWPVIG